MRNTFAGSREQTAINVACFENTPEKIDKPPIPHPPPDTLQKQPVMNRIERRHDRLPITKTMQIRSSSLVNGMYLKGAGSSSSGAS